MAIRKVLLSIRTHFFLTNAVDPRVMLVMSRDHQLYIKAYTDYSDLDEDGSLDTTYNDQVNYSGYFDSNKCYTYTNSRFEPSREVPNEGLHACGGTGEWSGNFFELGNHDAHGFSA
ncbi:hypothetical protein E4P82_14305 [Candidatus Competibacter phosphatis]|uniref:Uncharacterized protein n=1 Tax=Candidatus Competibacter phosphatis TaxID=221280 RepID=A0ABX1TNI2_9GAMM|nr:hypothetical protein [Candidatus Competibacter phosphatis]NMQ20266.1 hypothetical protein [Candidatus Competibacter phosphatis]